MSIEKVTSGSLAKNKKLNEVIKALNSVINMTVRAADPESEEQPKFLFGEESSELVITAGGEGSSGDFNLSLAVCNSGTPGYIDTIYDADTGFYTSTPNFPLPAP